MKKYSIKSYGKDESKSGTGVVGRVVKPRVNLAREHKNRRFVFLQEHTSTRTAVYLDRGVHPEYRRITKQAQPHKSVFVTRELREPKRFTTT